jgi:hypothetical protein
MMKTPDEVWQKAKAVLRPHDWNNYEILAEGCHIRLTFKSVVTIDKQETQTSGGIIALQLHAGPEMRVGFRNSRIKTLP